MGRSKKDRIAKQKEEEAYQRKIYRMMNSTSHRYNKRGKPGVYETFNSIPILEKLKDHWVRDISDYKPSSHNKEREQINLINWLLVSYKTPSFLYAYLLYGGSAYEMASYGGPISIADELNMFLCIAQGKSFYKQFSKYFTKKEAHCFINHKLKKPELSVVERYWYVICINSGISNSIALVVARKLNRYNVTQTLHFFKSLIYFFGNNGDDLNKDNASDLIDYLVTKRWDKKFSFKGRNIYSLTRLSNEWHIEQLKSKKIDSNNETWEGLSIPDWTYTKEGILDFTIKELKSTKALHIEGQKQKHCVGGYTHSCKRGYSAIFTLINNMDLTHITIEVLQRNGVIIQARGKCNKPPSRTELKVIERWARRYNLTFSL